MKGDYPPLSRYFPNQEAIPHLQYEVWPEGIRILLPMHDGENIPVADLEWADINRMRKQARRLRKPWPGVPV